MLSKTKALVRPLIPDRTTPYSKREMVAWAAAMPIMGANQAMAQDILGVTQVSTAWIATIKIIALMAIGFAGVMLLAGRHRLESMLAIGIGCLVIGKAQEIAALLQVV